MKLRVLAVIGLLVIVGCAKSFEEEYVQLAMEKGHTEEWAKCSLGYTFMQTLPKSKEEVKALPAAELEAARATAKRAVELLRSCSAVK